jgi:hypothetical protein
MKPPHPGAAAPAADATALRRSLAARVAQAHAPLDDGRMLAVLSGSVVEGLADERSDIDMSIVLTRLPDADALQAACVRAGGTPWCWQVGDGEDGQRVVAFHIDGIEAQIAYADHAALARDLDELLVAHNPDTPLHKLGEGLLKAEALAGADTLRQIQQRLAAFPDGLALAMVRHWLKEPTPWRAISQILHRDAALWCRELLVQAAWNQLGLLAGLSRRYFTRFQLKRMHKLAASFAIAPPDLADRIESLLQAPLPQGFAQLHALEGEVLALVGTHMPAVDLAAPLRRRADFQADT